MAFFWRLQLFAQPSIRGFDFAIQIWFSEAGSGFWRDETGKTWPSFIFVIQR